MAARRPKTYVISIRVPLELKEAVESNAVMARTTVSGFVVGILTTSLTGKKIERVTAPPIAATAQTVAPTLSLSDPACLEELRRIGVNINQLTRSANAGFAPDLAHLATSLGRLLEALADPAEFKRRLELMKAGTQRPTAPPPTGAPAQPAPPPIPKPLPPRAAPSQPERPPRPLPPRAAPSPQPIRTGPPEPKKSPPSPPPKLIQKEVRRDPPNPQERNKLQSGLDVRTPRRTGDDEGSGRLGLFSKLWKR